MLGEKIKVRKTELGLSQEFLAEKLNISRQAVSKWEAGKSVPSTANLLELSKLLNVDVSEFINEDIMEDDNKVNEKIEIKEKKMGFLLHLFFIILGALFFLAYTLIMKEVFKLDYKSTPWIILSIYMIFAIFTFPPVYQMTKGLENLDYFLFSKILLTILYMFSPIIFFLFNKEKYKMN